MKRGKKIVAFIPARGGSRGIPLKNIIPIGGRPLLYWVASACSNSSLLDETVVSTDSKEIRHAVESLDLDGVTVVDRSPLTATDHASTESAMMEFAEQTDADYVVLVQATSPLLTREDVDGAINTLFQGSYDSVLTVVRTKQFIWRKEADGSATPENYDPTLRPRRQDWEGQLIENGALYVTSRERLKQSGCRVSGRTGVYEMAAESYVELDDPSDWAHIDHHLRARRASGGPLPASAGPLELLCVDVDGTLTDGGMYYDSDGEAMKRFNTRDAMGMQRLRSAGVELAIVTAEASPIVASRARKLRISEVHLGVSDKEEFVGRMLARLGHRWESLAYVGDDVNDLGVIRRAGFSACPKDATNEVADVVHHVCEKRGGAGAVREVCDLILRAMKRGND